MNSDIKTKTFERGGESEAAPVQPGQIALANASRFNEAYLSQPLSAYAVGWSDDGSLLGDLDFVAPPVLVPRRFEYRKADNSEEFLDEREDIRAIGAEFRRVEPTGEIVLGKTYNKGLTLRVDLDQVSGIESWRQMAVARLLRRLLRSELRRAISFLYNAASSTSAVWSGAAAEDPDSDLLNALESAADDSGLKPNRILFGDSAWAARSHSHRAQSTAGGFASATLSPEALAALLGVEQVRRCSQRRQGPGAGKVGFAENLVLLFSAYAHQSVEDPSNIKRFVTPCEDGSLYRVYEQALTSKITDITVEHYSNIVITSSPGIAALAISTQSEEGD